MEDGECGDSGSEEDPAPAAAEASPCGYAAGQPMVLPLNGDEPMEPIEEERTPASISSSRSFSFVSTFIYLSIYPCFRYTLISSTTGATPARR